jgi:hypothetical protein
MGKIEDGVQRTLIEYLEAVVVPRPFVYAIPNAARRDRNGRAGNAVPGLRKGMPDLGFTYEGLVYFLETKTPDKRSRRSQAQIDTHAVLQSHRMKVATVASIAELRAALKEWGIKTREAKAYESANSEERAATGESAAQIERTAN